MSKKNGLIVIVVGVISIIFSQPIAALTWNPINSNTYYTGGNVGIGTTTPTSALHIKSNSGLKIENTGTYGIIDFYMNGNPNTRKGYIGYGNNNGTLELTNNGDIYMYSNGGFILLDGTVKAHEIQVKTNFWADYVFANDYKLKTLDEVEVYIKENKHLPGIQSAEEIKESGLSLGDMQNKQMEKIEELTLYVIQLQKEVNELKKN